MRGRFTGTFEEPAARELRIIGISNDAQCFYKEMAGKITDKTEQRHT